MVEKGVLGRFGRGVLGWGVAGGRRTDIGGLGLLGEERSLIMVVGFEGGFILYVFKRFRLASTFLGDDFV